MAQAIIDKINEDTLDDYRARAATKGRTLEDELRDLIEANRPRRSLDRDERLALSKQLRGQTGSIMTDSTPYIRWMRDTNAGRIPGSIAFEDDQADH